MKRIEAIEAIARVVTKEDLLTTSIGQTWDDWWNHRPANNTFFMGILGSVTPTALGLALALPHRRVIALDSDGSMLMNTGAMCTLGAQRPSNLTIVVMDNEIYENIGGPSTHTANKTDLAKMAEGAGCQNCVTARNISDFTENFERMLTDDEAGFLVAKIEPGKYPWEWEQRKSTDSLVNET